MTLSKNPAQSNRAPAPHEIPPSEWLECIGCGARYEVKPMFFGCPQCAADGRLLPVEMRYAQRALTPPPPLAHGVWGWSRALPTIAEKERTTLGEGATSLLPLPGIDPGPTVFLKNETGNPTWSWKDRPNAISISMAKHFGFGHVVAISTGNHGNAMAAMAAAAGLRATVFCRPAAPRFQLAMMAHYGARVVRGGNAEAMVLDLVRRGKYFPCTILSPRAGYSNPFGVEGFKTIAFEIWRQLGRVPDRIFVGVASGDGLYGIWKGFRELRDWGVVQTVPRMIACQPSGANSLVRAFRARGSTVTPLRSAKTVASSLADLAAGDEALRAVYSSGGAAIEVSDQEALAGMRWITQRGLALEPSSAVPLACLRNMLVTEGEAATAGEVWVSIGSGAAPKWPDDVLRGFTIPAVLPKNQAVLEDRYYFPPETTS